MKAVFLLEEIRRNIKAIKNIKNFLEYFSCLYNLTQKKYATIRMKNGLSYFLRTKTVDIHIFGEIALENTYLLENVELPEDALIIDLGAQIGLFSVYASNKAKKIFSFEPVPENYKLMLKNIELNKLENKIVPFNLAVSDKKEKQKIFLSEKNSAGHSIYGYLEEEKNNSGYAKKFLEAKSFSKKNYVNADSISLSGIFKKNGIKQCDLLKADIEGAEYKVFYNLPDNLFKKIKKIVMECHNIDKNKNNSASLIEFLKLKGYKVKCIKSILFGERN